MRNHLAIKVMAAAIVLAVIGTGCVALQLFAGGDDNPITFTDGELQSTESASFENLVVACRAAIEILGYDESDTLREEEHIRWQARTAGGDPVEIQLTTTDQKRIMLRIRIGIIGDEARSRLVLEEIHQSLEGIAATGS
ncbi:MAG: DUF3568 family protein [Myxococcales bacterium]|nr:DUF3568 family protein [Myxococcales bacterium]HIK86152.1 DUF3568 family protein [Myxococcales bacterium]